MSTKKVETTPWPVDEPEETLPAVIPFDDRSLVEMVNADREDTQREQHRLRAEVVQALQQPIETSLVKRRLVNPKQPHHPKTNPYLDYLEWPTVVRNLNRIFGFGRWNMEVVRTDFMGQQPNSSAPYMVVATVTLTVTFPNYETVGYTNVGTGDVRYDNWKGVDMAVKGAVWDGVKRCATALGDQFGLSLYEKEAPESTESTEETETEEPKVSQFKPRTTPPSPSKSGKGMEYFECEDCGDKVRGYTSKTGKTYTAQDLYEMSVKYAGAGYCWTCKKNHTN